MSSKIVSKSASCEQGLYDLVKKTSKGLACRYTYISSIRIGSPVDVGVDMGMDMGIDIGTGAAGERIIDLNGLGIGTFL